jgi:hypothetical protein
MTVSAGVAANAMAENVVVAAMATKSLESIKCLTPVLIVLKRPERLHKPCIDRAYPIGRSVRMDLCK